MMRTSSSGIMDNLKFFYRDSKKAFLTFWIILLGLEIIFGVAIYIGLNVSVGIAQNGVVYNMYIDQINHSAISVFMIVAGLLIYLEDFPVVIGLGSTRRDFYLGNLIGCAGLAAAMTLMQMVVFKIGEGISNITGLHLTGAADQSSNIIIGPAIILGGGIQSTAAQGGAMYFLSQFIGYMLIISIFNLLGIAIYRLGHKIWIYLGGLTILGNLIPILLWETSSPATQDSITHNLITIYEFYQGNVMITAIGLAIIFFVISWFPTRKAEVK